MIGRTIAHYKIVGLLGKGGMGEVYQAQDTRLGRDVALKVLPSEVAHDPGLRSRLEREARSIATLQHPNIVTLFAVEEDQGRIFLTMELVRGPTLSEVIGDGLETGRLLELAVPLADAIGAAHQKGLAHRDLKPSNVMLDDNGRVKVLDFGLAKQVGLSSLADETVMADVMTREGMIVGTYAYLSPEQAQGKPTDTRSDVFSLGIILYEMATGCRPFGGDNPMAVISAIIKDPPTPRRSLHPRLAPIIERCLKKDPEHRYASAVEIHRDLAELKQQLDSTERTPALRTTWRSIRWGLLVVLPVLGFVGWRLLSSSTSPRDEATVAPMAQVVVVFPFENLGPPEDAYFAEGMTDEIVSRLTSVAGIGVISRTTAIQYERKGKSLNQIGEDLGVSFVLEGTIRWDRREGINRVRITPQLVRVADGVNAWSTSYDRELQDVFAVQSEIANRVVTSIDASLVAGSRPDPPRTTNLEAYDYFLKAKEYTRWGVGPSKSQLDRAAALLDQSLALDPEFALALAQLSMVQSSMYFLRFDPTQERLLRAEQAAGDAVRLQPNLAEGYLAMGLYHYRSTRDYARALEELHVARQLEPGNGEILSWIGTIRKRQGHFEEAREILGQAIRLDPRNPTTVGEMIVVCRALRDFPSVLQWSDRLVEVDPSLGNQSFRARYIAAWHGDLAPWRAVLEAADSPSGREWARLLAFEHKFDDALASLDSTRIDSTNVVRVANDMVFRVQLQAWRGNRVEARALAEQAIPILERLVSQDPQSEDVLALAYAYAGRRDEAHESIERARERLLVSLDALQSTQVLLGVAAAYTVLGDTSTAISLLDELLRAPGGVSVGTLETDPQWDALRDSAGFRALLDRHRRAEP